MEAPSRHLPPGLSAMLRPLLCTLLLGLVFVSHVRAADQTPPRLLPTDLRGNLLYSATPTNERVVQRFTRLAGDEKAKLVVLSLTKENAGLDKLQAALEAAKPASLAVLTCDTAEAAREEKLLTAVSEATGVWLSAGADQAAFVIAAESPLLTAIKKMHAEHVIALNGQAIVAQMSEHFLPGIKPVKEAGEVASGKVGIELNDESAWQIEKRTLRNLSERDLKIHLAKSAGRETRVVTLSSQRGGQDLVELRRAAWGRTLDKDITTRIGVPEVPKGALVIVGGGGMPRETSQRFFDLGGGKEGKFIVLPTAVPDPIPPDGFANVLKRLGAKEVTVLTSRDAEVLNSEETLTKFKEATGIWFGGGRQWMFIDAYEGTKVVAAMHDLLARGGVIAGSSAGATIQGEYLVRGAPAGPQIMMCEGYERGLAFLPGVAIDQHFTQRKRQPDMTALMKVYPNYLGIGLDEATAIVVQGSTAEIIGPGKVHFYDRRKEIADAEHDYEAFGAGNKYDLKERKLIKE